MLLLDYAFNTLNLHKICSNAYDFNKASQAYSKKCGYKVEAILKEHAFCNGRYVDQVVLAVFREDWLPLWKKFQRTGRL
jgi:RimJ/RimL family protein N-acetyltransferase